MAKRPGKSDAVRTMTFRPSADTRRLIESAVTHLGVTASELINESLRRSLLAVITSRVQSRTKDLDKFQRDFLIEPDGDDDKSYSTT